MKNYRFLIVFITMVGLFWSATSKTARAGLTDSPYLAAITEATQAAQATSGFTASVQAWYKVYTVARDELNSQIQNFQSNLNKQLASHMVDQKKNQDAWQRQQAAAHGMTNDYSEAQKAAQEAIHLAAQRNGEALLAALQRNKPNPNDCINITTRLLTAYNEKQASQVTQPLIASAIKNATQPDNQKISYGNSVNNLKAIADPTNQSYLKYQPDVNVVIANCPNSTCYNDNFVEMRMAEQFGAGAAPPKNISNPSAQMLTWIRYYSKWSGDHSVAVYKAVAAANRIGLKYPEHYTQALNALENNQSLSPDDAAAQIKTKYKNADKIGLTIAEMDTIVADSLSNATPPAAPGALASAKSAVAYDEKSQTEFDEAMKVAEIPANPPPTNAIPTK